MLTPLYKYLESKTDITPKQFRKMKRHLEVRRFKKSTHLLQVGQMDSYANFVLSGLTRKYFYRRSDEVIVEFSKENNFIHPTPSFCCDKPSDYVIETLEPTVLVSITKNNINKLASLDMKVERVIRKLMMEFTIQKEKWAIHRLTTTTKDLFTGFVKDNPDLVIRVPQKYLASYLNITPENYSRYKKLL